MGKVKWSLLPQTDQEGQTYTQEQLGEKDESAVIETADTKQGILKKFTVGII